MNHSILMRRPARGPVSLVGRPQQQLPQQRAQPTPETQSQPPRIRLPEVAPCATPRTTPVRQTVVVDDMVVVAEDTDDSDAEIIDDSDERDSDGEAKPKVIKVITRKPAGVPTGGSQPAYCALLRRTPNSRTASIACTVPSARGRGVAARPVGALQQRAAAQQGQTSLLNPSRLVNVPARVLVPRSRMVVPVSTPARSASFPVGRQGGKPVSISPGAGNAAVAVQSPGRMRRGGRVQAVSVLGTRIFVSAKGPLSAPEKAVLDGVLEMQEEQWLRMAASLTLAVAPPAPAPSAMPCCASATQEEAAEKASYSFVEIEPLMDRYGVSPLDTFHGDFEEIVIEL